MNSTSWSLALPSKSWLSFPQGWSAHNLGRLLPPAPQGFACLSYYLVVLVYRANTFNTISEASWSQVRHLSPSTTRSSSLTVSLSRCAFRRVFAADMHSRYESRNRLRTLTSSRGLEVTSACPREVRTFAALIWGLLRLGEGRKRQSRSTGLSSCGMLSLIGSSRTKTLNEPISTSVQCDGKEAGECAFVATR